MSLSTAAEEQRVILLSRLGPFIVAVFPQHAASMVGEGSRQAQLKISSMLHWLWAPVFGLMGTADNDVSVRSPVRRVGVNCCPGV